eukprot:TRINITY_DN5429_c0_g1_i1.p1 TRINITY_DN5429_c0_g1~~TRINITY_DN5429_c0_g1_i1.p1  ORF type:complete len:341 (-),score=102.45 TRINITY_DN5429_c0_g1_i1:211-1233(-)
MYRRDSDPKGPFGGDRRNERRQDDQDEPDLLKKRRSEGGAGYSDRDRRGHQQFSDDEDSDGRDRRSSDRQRGPGGYKRGGRSDSDDQGSEDEGDRRGFGGRGGDDKNQSEVIVKGLSWSAEQRDIEKHFSAFGSVSNVNLLKGPDGRSKGIAFVRFDSPSSVDGALSQNGTEFMSRTIYVEKTRPREDRNSGRQQGRSFGGSSGGGGGSRENNSTTVFVGNLSYGISEDALQDFFEDCGSIKAVRLPKDNDGKLRGFAYVEFDSSRGVQKAVEKNGEEFEGRNIKVDFQRQGGDRDRGGRGGFGGRGGGRGRGFGGGRGFDGGRGRGRGRPGIYQDLYDN